MATPQIAELPDPLQMLLNPFLVANLILQFLNSFMAAPFNAKPSEQSQLAFTWTDWRGRERQASVAGIQRRTTLFNLGMLYYNGEDFA